MTKRTVHTRASLAAALLLTVPAAASAQIPASEFAARRATLAGMAGDGLYYFAGAPAPANDYSIWAQEAVFHYLTGYEEPDARLLMLVRGEQARAMLFVLPRNPGREVWEGARYGIEGAVALTGMEAYPLDRFDDVLAEVLRQAPPAVVSLAGPTQDEQVGVIMERLAAMAGRRPVQGGGGGVKWVAASPLISQMRGLKSAAEIDLLRTASSITRLAHLAAMKAAAPGMNEFELQALIEYEFRRNGAGRPGFATIVGSGPNSTTLHYNANDRFMQAGEMVVMDIGAEYGRYTTDITRTIPVSGTFTREQREIYDIVYAAHQAAFELARTEGTNFAALSAAAQKVLAEGLARLGLIEAADATIPGTRRPQFGLFYMHGLGHGIGLDVHDAMPRTIQVGDCFTIEPGLYIRPDALDQLGTGPEADRLRETLRPAVMKYANIGIRLEDSYVFTAEGLERLSAEIPRTPEEIEAAMKGENFANHTRDEALIEQYRVIKPPPR